MMRWGRLFLVVLAASAALEQALGLVTQEQRTMEYYLGSDVQVQRQIER